MEETTHALALFAAGGEGLLLSFLPSRQPGAFPSQTHSHMSGRHASALMGALARRAVAGPRAVLPSRGGGGGPVAPRGRTTEPVRERRGLFFLLFSFLCRERVEEMEPYMHGLREARMCGGATVHAGKKDQRRPQERESAVAVLLSHALSLSPTLTQLAAEDELTWDDGTVNPEYCVDRWDDVGKVRDGGMAGRREGAPSPRDPNPGCAAVFFFVSSPVQGARPEGGSPPPPPPTHNADTLPHPPYLP